ncbi:tyrosine-type recombinase/integrase [Dichelobacter nodosus]|uniref:tyrosine-type recombinase/integrase n=1 Tax=Dichelobacter nodosus TaxID=870 RepID=UPI0006819467|nr:tyrosine-type recombinase/integrase [Dichelobacter nodosus]KNZ40011.1 hypothetical protein AKG33_00775 [Dichelobacter nodosus]
MKLRELIVRQAKLPKKAKKLFDGGGLFLYLTPSGKYWYYRYRFAGKDKVMPLGKYPHMNLKEARIAHIEAKIKLSNGCDPVEENNRLKREQERNYNNSFEEIAKEWYQHVLPEWKNKKHAQQVINTLSQYAFPKIGHYPIDDVPPIELFNLLHEIRDKAETASRLKQRIKAVFDFAIQTGRAKTNPALSAPKIIRNNDNKVKHHPALPESRIKEFYQRLENYPNRTTQLALQFLILTFVRVGELRQGEWTEIKGNEWHIPAEKMKMKRPHVVPLSSWALAILEELKIINKYDCPYFIIGNRNQQISDNTLSVAMKRLGYQNIATPHGFRAMASTILNESGLWNPDAIERQLSHVDRNAVRAAYNRAEYLEERHRMMEWYSDYIKSLINE